MLKKSKKPILPSKMEQPETTKPNRSYPFSLREKARMRGEL